jgi:WD40 repeat protein
VTIPVKVIGNAFAIAPDFTTMSIDNTPETGKETLVDLATGVVRTVHGQHTAQVLGSIFSPDSRLVLTGGDDEVARVWDVASGELLQTLAGHNGRVFGPAVTEVGGRLTAWTVSLDGSLMAWDLSGDRSLPEPFPAGQGVDADTAPSFGTTPHLAISPDGRLLAVGQNGGAAIFDASTHQLVRQIRTVATDAAPDVKWSPDGSRLAVTGDGADSVELFDTSTWTSLRGPLPGPAADLPAQAGTSGQPNAAEAIAFSADSRSLAAGTDDGMVYVWGAHSGALDGSPIDVGAPIRGLGFDALTGWLAVAFDLPGPNGGPNQGWSAVYAIGDPSPRYKIEVDPGGRSAAVAFSPDGKLLATGGGTGDVRLWDAATGAPVGAHILVADGWVLTIGWSTSGTTIVTAGTDGTIRLVDVASGALETNHTAHPNQAAAPVFSHDRQRLYAASQHSHRFH